MRRDEHHHHHGDESVVSQADQVDGTENHVGKGSDWQGKSGQDEGHTEGAHGPDAQIKKVTQGKCVVCGVLREQRRKIRPREWETSTYGQVGRHQGRSGSQQKEDNGDAASGDAARITG